MLPMDDAMQQRVVAALEGVGADEVRLTTQWTAKFGRRTVVMTVLDAGELFHRRYEAFATDEAGRTVTGDPSVTVTGAVGSIPWGELLLD